MTRSPAFASVKANRLSFSIIFFLKQNNKTKQHFIVRVRLRHLLTRKVRLHCRVAHGSCPFSFPLSLSLSLSQSLHLTFLIVRTSTCSVSSTYSLYTCTVWGWSTSASKWSPPNEHDLIVTPLYLTNPT